MKTKLIAILTLCVVFFSCSKDVHEPTQPPVDVFKVITTQAWQLKELRTLQTNTPYYYLRGGLSNTVNFDKEYVYFKNDYTGTYYNGAVYYNIPSWKFADSAKSILQYTINYSGQNLVVTWEHLKVTKDSLNYDEYYKRGSTQSLSVATRTPIAIPTTPSK